MTRDDAIRDYAATAEAWRTFCDRGQPPHDLYSAPTSVPLLYATAAPAVAQTGKGIVDLSGDVIVDAMRGLRTFVRLLDGMSAKGGGGGLWVDNEDIDAWLRRLDIVIELRKRENDARGAKPEGGAS